MNKLAVIAISLLVVFLGWCAYLSHNLSSEQIQQMRIAPNHMHRIQLPPPVAPEEVRAEVKLMASTAADVDQHLVINGKRIATVAISDSQSMNHARMRKFYGVHE